MMNNSKRSYGRNIDMQTRSTNFTVKKANIHRAQKLLQKKNEKSTILKFLEEVRKGEIHPPQIDDSFYNHQIFRNRGENNESYVGRNNPMLLSKSKKNNF